MDTDQYLQSGAWVNESHLIDFKEAALDKSHVKGLTHDFYRYPARFSPVFIKKAIQTFTQPGDLIIDPFIGGGTTAVEARALGRRCIGIDINSLAIFVSQVKTTPLSNSDIECVKKWRLSLPEALNLRNPSPVTQESWLQYHRNIDADETQPIRKTIQLALKSIAHEKLSSKQERFARCSILKASQWALDSRKELPSTAAFREKLYTVIDEMLVRIKEFSETAYLADKLWDAKNISRTTLLNRSVIGIEKDERLDKFEAPKLILTSPPYPGVHVLYHRWQVKGRRETPAPYWIANKLDGSGLSYYTFGDRKEPGLTSYFTNVLQTFKSLAKIADKNTTVIQTVAFNEPQWQLPLYLEMMSNAGFHEINHPTLSNKKGRLWRDVPNRKWFASQKGNTHSSKEVVLIHKLLT